MMYIVLVYTHTYIHTYMHTHIHTSNNLGLCIDLLISKLFYFPGPDVGVLGWCVS